MRYEAWLCGFYMTQPRLRKATRESDSTQWQVRTEGMSVETHASSRLCVSGRKELHGEDITVHQHQGGTKPDTDVQSLG